MFTLKLDFSLKTHIFEVFHLITLKQQIFLNVMDHINVAYEYKVSTTPERKKKSE